MNAGWWLLPDMAARNSQPLLGLWDAEAREFVDEITADVEHELGLILRATVPAWLPALPGEMPEGFEDHPGEYAEIRTALEAGRVTGSVDLLRLVEWLRGPNPGGYPPDLQDRAGRSFWSTPASATWAAVDRDIDAACGGRWTLQLAALDHAERRLTGAWAARDAAAAGQGPWPGDLELVQIEGTRRWGPYVAHGPLISDTLLLSLGGLDVLEGWGASVVPVRALTSDRTPRTDYALLAVEAHVDDLPDPGGRELLCRGGLEDEVLASGPVVERLRPLAPRRWNPSRY
jgi:hypothetical protein